MLRILECAGPDGLTTNEWYDLARAEDIGVGRTATLSEAKNDLVRKAYVYEDGGIYGYGGPIKRAVR
jgi:hypothetical protein